MPLTDRDLDAIAHKDKISTWRTQLINLQLVSSATRESSDEYSEAKTALQRFLVERILPLLGGYFAYRFAFDASVTEQGVPKIHLLVSSIIEEAGDGSTGAPCVCTDDDDAVDWDSITRKEMYGRAIARVHQELIRFKTGPPADWEDNEIPRFPTEDDNARCDLAWQLEHAWQLISFLAYQRGRGRWLSAGKRSDSEGYTTLNHHIKGFCEQICDVPAMVVRHAAQAEKILTVKDVRLPDFVALTRPQTQESRDLDRLTSSPSPEIKIKEEEETKEEPEQDIPKAPSQAAEATWNEELDLLVTEHRVILRPIREAWSAHPGILPALDAADDSLKAEWKRFRAGAGFRGAGARLNYLDYSRLRIRAALDGGRDGWFEVFRSAVQAFELGNIQEASREERHTFDSGTRRPVRPQPLPVHLEEGLSKNPGPSKTTSSSQQVPHTMDDTREAVSSRTRSRRRPQAWFSAPAQRHASKNLGLPQERTVDYREDSLSEDGFSDATFVTAEDL